MQLVRVPNFQNVTINSASTITLSFPQFLSANGYGGVFAMRVNGTLTSSGGATHGISMLNSGFSGGSTGSSGNQGQSHTSSGGSSTAAKALVEVAVWQDLTAVVAALRQCSHDGIHRGGNVTVHHSGVGFQIPKVVQQK